MNVASHGRGAWHGRQKHTAPVKEILVSFLGVLEVTVATTSLPSLTEREDDEAATHRQPPSPSLNAKTPPTPSTPPSLSPSVFLVQKGREKKEEEGRQGRRETRQGG